MKGGVGGRFRLHLNQALHSDHRDVIGLFGVVDMNQQFIFYTLE